MTIENMKRPEVRLDAEHAVLGGLMLANTAWDRVGHRLDDACFFGQKEREIFNAIQCLAITHRPIDAVTVTTQMQDLGTVELVDGGKEVSRIVNTTPSAANIGAYVTILEDARLSRKVMQIACELYGVEGTGPERFEWLRGQVAEAEAMLGGDRSATVSGDAALDALFADLLERHEQNYLGLETGFADLDRLLQGLEGGDLVVIGGRPSMGKTTLMLNVVQGVACPVLVFSLEMPIRKLMARMMASCGVVDHGRLKQPRKLEDSDWPLLTRGREKIKRDLYINDTGGIDIARLESEAKRLYRTRGIGLICVDYLQLVTCRAENRLEVVSEISRRLKALAKNLNIPVLALCQLNRQSENTPKPVPKLAHLRESGQIEQDADVVIFVHRPEVYAPDTRPGEADLIVAKNRDGETGIVRMAWDGKHQRFLPLARDPYLRSAQHG